MNLPPQALDEILKELLEARIQASNIKLHGEQLMMRIDKIEELLQDD